MLILSKNRRIVTSRDKVELYVHFDIMIRVFQKKVNLSRRAAMGNREPKLSHEVDMPIQRILPRDLEKT